MGAQVAQILKSKTKSLYVTGKILFVQELIELIELINNSTVEWAGLVNAYVKNSWGALTLCQNTPMGHTCSLECAALRSIGPLIPLSLEEMIGALVFNQFSPNRLYAYCIFGMITRYESGRGNVYLLRDLQPILFETNTEYRNII